MALYFDLPVYRDVYRLILRIFEYTEDFSREYKCTSGQDPKRDSTMRVCMNIASDARGAMSFTVKR
jgi:hypothetical protein